MKYRILLLGLLLGAAVAGVALYADRAPWRSAETPTPPAAESASSETLPDDVLPVPALPQPGVADPLAEQAHIIPALAPRSEGFATRTLPADHLTIPSISLDTRVVPLGTHYDRTGSLAWETAAFAVGHHRGSANPGEPGNIVLSGHISSPSEGAIFQRLPQVQVGDSIVIGTAQAQFLYRVSDVSVVAPTAVEVLEATAGSIATLITCYPDRVYSHRLIVRAQAV